MKKVFIFTITRLMAITLQVANLWEDVQHAKQHFNFFLFFFLLVQLFGRTTKSLFRKVLSFATQESFDQDWAYFTGQTKKRLCS